MDLVVYTYYVPKHNLEIVASNITCQHLAERLLHWSMTANTCEMVFIATCQRVIWALWGGDGTVLTFLDKADHFRGAAAWRHLLEVATGLNSVNIGDCEIISQIRQALVIAKEVGVAGSEAHAVIEDIIREANRLRSRIGLCDHSASVATAVIKYLESNLAVGSRVALVGSGPMIRYLAMKLPKVGMNVTMSNRTLDKVRGFGLNTVPLEQLKSDPNGFDAIISATSSDVPLFTLNSWSSLDRLPMKMIDLALPCDSEPDLSSIPWITRVDLAFFLAETDDARLRRSIIASSAEPFIIGAVERLRKRSFSRFRKNSTRTAHEKLADAWTAMEAEMVAPGSALANLKQAEKLALESLLKRGRTLAFRAIVAQSQSILVKH